MLRAGFASWRKSTASPQDSAKRSANDPAVSHSEPNRTRHLYDDFVIPADPALAAVQQLTDLLDATPDVLLCVKDRTGLYLAANRAFVERTGRASKRDVLGRRAADFFPKLLADRYEAQDQQVWEHGETLHDALERIEDFAGSEGWYLTSKSLLRDPNGEPRALMVISNALESRGATHDDADTLGAVLAYVSTHLAEPVTVLDLATAAGLSTAQVERRMRRLLGLSPKQYLLKARVDEAARLLRHSQATLAEIAGQCGWYDQSAFTNQFVRATGLTPKEFRDRPV